MEMSRGTAPKEQPREIDAQPGVCRMEIVGPVAVRATDAFDYGYFPVRFRGSRET